MQKFTDCKNREWDLEITVETIDQLRLNGIDVFEIEKFVGSLQDPVFLARCLFGCVHDQAAERNVDLIEFKKSLRGDVVEQGKEALLAEYVDFFPSSRQPMIRSALDRATLVIQKLADFAAKETESFDADALARKIWTNMKKTNPPDLDSDDSSLKPPESPESIPGDTQ